MVSSFSSKSIDHYCLMNPSISNNHHKAGLVIVGTVIATTGLLALPKISGEDASGETLRRQLQSLMGFDEVKTDAYTKPNWRQSPPYIPGPAEQFVVENLDTMSYETRGNDPRSGEEGYYVDGCSIWNDRRSTPFYDSLHQYLGDLDSYNERTGSFEHEMDDVRMGVKGQADELHSYLDMENVFSSGQASTCRHGLIEPILAPMRHPRWCLPNPEVDQTRACPPTRPDCHYLNRDYLLDTSFLVHDWSAIGRSIQPNSRTVFIDMGASLSFHKKNWHEVPVMDLIRKFLKFGVNFDHYYGYELKPQPPADAFDRVPDFLMASYHWINTGVETNTESKLNPLTMIKNNYNRDDFVVVKIDIDNTPMERAFIDQLLQDDELAEKIDVLYWEHHVGLKGFKAYGESPKVSVELMHNLRQRGICAHYWI